MLSAALAVGSIIFFVVELEFCFYICGVIIKFGGIDYGRYSMEAKV